MKKKAGIKEIAEAAKVSIGTVDRALNGRSGISEATRQRVLEVAQQLLYQPNLAARVLSKGRADFRIGVCVPREIRFYYDYLWEGILSEARRYSQLGAEFLNRPAPALGEGDDELLRGFLNDGVRGMIVTPGNPAAITPLINEAEEKNVRVVCVTTDAPLSKRSSIIGGQPRLAGAMAGELMAKFCPAGAQVAIITGQLYTEDQREKTEGFSGSFPKQCENGRITAVIEAHEDEDECFRKTFDLLGENADLAGIYVNTANCLPVCRAIGARRLAGKVKLITSDLFPDLVPYFDKGTISASIHQRPHRQGQLAVRQLLDNLLQGTPFTNNFLNPGVVLHSNLRFFREIQRPFSPRRESANSPGSFLENVEDFSGSMTGSVKPSFPLTHTQSQQHQGKYRTPSLVLMSLCLWLSVSLQAQQKTPANPPVPWDAHFQDIARQAGLTVPHISSAEKHYIIESVSGGVGLFDCDNDGKLDIVVVNGSTVDRFRQGGDAMVTLYHQDADMKFTDITRSAGLTVKGWGMGVAVADFDNDGLLDLYVTGYGHNVLYKNLGNCKFQDVTEHAGVAGGGFSTGAAWADYDRDGNVDLFVSRYVHVDIDKLPAFGSNDKFCRFKGVLVQCGPWGMEGESDFLFHNRGDGTFEEVSKKARVDDPAHRFGLGVIWGDYDNDGWPDLYVANDAGPNFLYHNKHDGTFEETGLLSGVALSSDGQELGSMGVDFGDYDRDGRLDILVTNFVDQPDNLYRNLGAQGFTDMGWASRISQINYPFVKWGTGLVDFDNSGWLDAFIANGHVYPQVDAIHGSVPYRQPLQLLANQHNGTFMDVSAAAGLEQIPWGSWRGAAFGDINNDGNIDVVLLNVGEPPSLLLNQVRNRNHRVLFHLIGTKSNRAAIGARVTVQSGSATQFKEVRGGGSYISQNDLRLHFGLGTEDKMSTVEISWPSGKKDVLHDVAADFIYTIVEGDGIRQRTPLPPPAAGDDPKASTGSRNWPSNKPWLERSSKPP